MADIEMLGLFHEATPTADTIDQLRNIGIPDDRITVMSGIPYRAEMLGRPRSKRKVGLIALLGAVLGLAAGLFLTVGIFLLYPLVQGGQPIVPIPPTLIVLFETTMLGAMWAAFFGLLGENRFPVFKARLYDPRITEGHIGVRVRADESLERQIKDVLEDNGAHHLRREVIDEFPDYRLNLLWGGILGALVILVVITLLFSYDVTKIHLPTNMEEQASIAHLQGPRLAAPAEAVPLQGPVLIEGQPASEPVPPSPDSLQRGEVMFGITCAVCHGQKGDGESPLSGFFSPDPPDLSEERIQKMSDNELYLIVTQGRGIMPSMAENLDRTERWDVINYLRTLGE